jgi:uncharacterized protein YqeY
MDTLVRVSMSEDADKVTNEVDMLFDYMDERVEDGATAEEVMAAIVVVLALVAEGNGDIETMH